MSLISISTRPSSGHYVSVVREKDFLTRDLEQEYQQHLEPARLPRSPPSKLAAPLLVRLGPVLFGDLGYLKPWEISKRLRSQAWLI
jgi:hypothetical protein